MASNLFRAALPVEVRLRVRKCQPIAPRSAPDPIPAKEPTNTWKVVAGIGGFALSGNYRSRMEHHGAFGVVVGAGVLRAFSFAVITYT